ncbi:MAG: hypothetical protein QM520_00590 [Gammaproteobacteria bacterium]|nr:hypothetical protein [Gammaproteobacteria bacterium]
MVPPLAQRLVTPPCQRCCLNGVSTQIPAFIVFSLVQDAFILAIISYQQKQIGLHHLSLLYYRSERIQALVTARCQQYRLQHLQADIFQELAILFSTKLIHKIINATEIYRVLSVACHHLVRNQARKKTEILTDLQELEHLPNHEDTWVLANRHWQNRQQIQLEHQFIQTDLLEIPNVKRINTQRTKYFTDEAHKMVFIKESLGLEIAEFAKALNIPANTLAAYLSFRVRKIPPDLLAKCHALFDCHAATRLSTEYLRSQTMSTILSDWYSALQKGKKIQKEYGMVRNLARILAVQRSTVWRWYHKKPSLPTLLKYHQVVLEMLNPEDRQFSNHLQS